MKKPTTTPAKARILLVDDHPLVREGIAQRLNRQDDLEVCGEAGDGPAALEAIPRVKPDLAIVDISLKSSNGLELIKDIKVRYPKLPMLVLSVHDELQYAERALQAGAKGYVSKQADPEVLERAIRQVLRGQVFASEQVSKKILNRVAGVKAPDLHSPLDLLSDREIEVFELLGQGYNAQEIAGQLHLSAKTVASHRENIKRKLQIPSTQELVRFAIPWARPPNSAPKR